MFPFPVIAPSLRTVLDSYYVGTSEVIASATTFNHNSVDIGIADPTRLIVVTTAAYSSGPTITGVTLNGNAMTKAVNNVSASALTDVAIFYLAWPTGTTADFVVTKGGGNSSNNHLSVHALYGLQSNTPYSTTISDADPAALDDDIDAQSFGIALAQSAGGSGTINWTGLDENYSVAGWGGNNKNIEVASSYLASAETPRTIAADYVSVTAHSAAAFAVWK